MDEFDASDSLTEFPPKTVCLKRPFGMQPWVESEESVGSILMVTRLVFSFKLCIFCATHCGWMEGFMGLSVFSITGKC